jgi:GAF domain-containing protein
MGRTGRSARPAGVPLPALLIGAAGVAAITAVAAQIRSITDRPGSPLMAGLLLVIAVTLLGGRAAGLATAALTLVVTDWFFARPLHSLRIDTTEVRVLIAGFAVASVVIVTMVDRLVVARRDAESARRRADDLQRLTAAFSRARTEAAVYEVVLSEGREVLGADGGLVALPSADGTRIELAATLGFTDEELAAWRSFPADVRTPLGDAMATGEAVFVDDSATNASYPALGASSPPTLSVPLRGDEDVFGTLGFRFVPGHRFSTAQRTFATTLGEQCAHALERARLYDAERRSRSALALLASIGEQIARSLDPGSAVRSLAELAVPAVADQCIVDVLHGDTIERRALVHADGAQQDAARVLEQFAPDLTSDTPVALAIRSGEAQVIYRTEALPDSAFHNDEHRRAVEQIQLQSMLAVPMVVRGRTIGALTFGWRQPRSFDPADIELASQLARRLGVALDNGTLYQEAHHERERLSALVRQLPLGVLIAEAPSGRELLANARAEAILGTARALDPDAPHLAFVRQALAGRPVSEGELQLQRADGSRGVISISAEPVRDSGGVIVAAVATLFDLTEHRRREETLAYLAEASEVLSRTLASTSTLEELVRLAVPRLADWCSIDLIEHGRARTVEVANVDGAAARAVRELLGDRLASTTATTGTGAAIRTGRAELLAAIPADLLADDGSPLDLLRALHRSGAVPRSAITAPLRAHGRTVGALTLVTAESGRRLSEVDLALAEDLARRAALAIDNARLYEAQHEIAHTLQQSLLPGRLVQPPGMEIAARYRPAGLGAEVGGDFYDAWPIQDGFAIAIGDVAGKGASAAALTALTRHAMRISSRYERSPGDVLRVANDAIIGHDRSGEFCTAALAFLRPESGGYRVTTACAGHAPPLLLRNRTGATEQAGICGTLLGVDASAQFHDYDTVLAVGDVLTFWTDGVTERRNEGTLFGEERLAALIETLAGRPAEEIVRRIDEAVVDFAPGLPDDDVAILAARLNAPVLREVRDGSATRDGAIARGT